MDIQDTQFFIRIKSFGWRFGIYLITAALAWLAQNIGLLNLSPALTAVIAFLLGEITKAWANRQNSLGKTFLGRIK